MEALQYFLSRTKVIEEVPTQIQNLIKVAVDQFREAADSDKSIEWFVVCVTGFPASARIIGIVPSKTINIIGRSVGDIKSLFERVDSSVIRLTETEEIRGYYNLYYSPKNGDAQFRDIYSVFPLDWVMTSNITNIRGIIEYTTRKITSSFPFKKVLLAKDLDKKVVSLIKTLDFYKEHPLFRRSGIPYSQLEVCKCVLSCF